MRFDDVGYVAGRVYRGITDANGDRYIILAEKGRGAADAVKYCASSRFINQRRFSRSVKFTIATSGYASGKMWRPYSDTITVGDWTLNGPNWRVK